ncbi:hypothetical protein ZWY2020_002686 [Hordeum vulgare]|nr:hypothetical protein ZWY2020_002686 [Hordeum vulgare]
MVSLCQLKQYLVSVNWLGNGMGDAMRCGHDEVISGPASIGCAAARRLDRIHFVLRCMVIRKSTGLENASAEPNSGCREDYNVTLVYYLSHYLVDIVSEKADRVLNLGKIYEGRNWLGADVLVFDSWHWWPCFGKDQP